MALVNLIQGKQINVNLTGSFTGSFTGTLTGTSSYALTASYALNAGGGGASFPYTGNAVISGSLLVSSSLTVTGSLRVSGSITGSLFGTSSWATNTISSSYALSSSFAVSSSRATSAATASYSTTLGANLGQAFGSNTVALNNSGGGTLSYVTIDNVSNAGYAASAGTANDVANYAAATIQQINVGETNNGNYAYIVRAQELEQSKHTTINIYNNLNFT